MLDVRRLATMNVDLLQELPIEEVLEIHPLVDLTEVQWRVAVKTKSIKARPINTILDKSEQDQSVWDKFLLTTLEGNQPLKRNSFICWGANNDVWQQSHDKLHQKYTPTEVDEDGWTTFVPVHDEGALVNALRIDFAEHLGPYGGFSITNPWWGDERLLDGAKLYLHYGVEGDWVLQNRKDPSDTYRIAKQMFEATYQLSD